MADDMSQAAAKYGYLLGRCYPILRMLRTADNDLHAKLVDLGEEIADEIDRDLFKSPAPKSEVKP